MNTIAGILKEAIEDFSKVPCDAYIIPVFKKSNLWCFFEADHFHNSMGLCDYFRNKLPLQEEVVKYILGNMYDQNHYSFLGFSQVWVWRDPNLRDEHFFDRRDWLIERLEKERSINLPFLKEE